MTIFERKSLSEELDVANIIRGILAVQAAFAAAQKRPLARGTHSKGICARATFEVFDLNRTTGDPQLASRLAHGLFAQPGTYPATVRFANAASTFYPDKQPDLRAFSFSVELPAGMAANTAYQDYSLQSARCFPINDAHTFAVLMSVLSGETGADKLKAIWRLSFMDFCRFARAAFLGKMQERGKIRAYQQMRYWSTTPFRNGPFEAAQFSAIPREHNPAQPLDDGNNALQDELVRHLNQDEHMSSFDFGVQLLDAEHMTRWGFRRDPSFWIENASVVWKESRAPFHVVGRLTLVAKSILPGDECEPRHIDVTAHSTPDSQPLGSVNRARRSAEVTSKKVRLGEATADSILETLPMGAPGPRRRLRPLVKLLALGAVLLLGLYGAAGIVYNVLAARNIPLLEPIDNVRYLDQGWGLDRASRDRETFYYTAQGTGMHGVRYSWFVHLERPFSRTRVADPDHMRSLNFIVDTVPTRANPDHLPIGFARRFDDTTHEEMVDITCSACHNAQWNFTKNGTTTAIRIDGGPALNAFTDIAAGSFQVEMILSVTETLFNPLKFRRFAAQVLGPDANTLGGKWRLWHALRSVWWQLVTVAGGSSWKSHYPVQEGYGRTDALARIGNVVFGDHIDSANYHTGDGPVSFPYLWNIWKFDWVQYNASVSQPMARNVGEAMGVGATYQFVDDYGRPLPKEDRYRSTVLFDNLTVLEGTLQRLTPPRWPEDILGTINKASADRGKALFQQHCVGCHGPHIASQALKQATSPGRQATDPMWVIRWVDQREVGTDPAAAMNFVRNRVDMSRLGLTMEEVAPQLKSQYELAKSWQEGLLAALPQEIARRKAAGADAAEMRELDEELQDAKKNWITDEFIAEQTNSLDFTRMNVGRGLNILGMMMRERYYSDHHYNDQMKACLNGFGTLDLPEVNPGYKPRPLEGVWATPPFLHNGSVPNIYELLSPVKERSMRFFVGRREYDPEKVGLVTTPASGSSSGFWLDTSRPGNLNIGHEFGAAYKPHDPNNPESVYEGGLIGPALSRDDRKDLVEYLKIHRDEPTPPGWQAVNCFAPEK